jgi:hypothetical protein
MSKLTIKNVRASLAALGLSIRKNSCGEFRVNFKNGKEATAYYTDCLSDALNTGVAMVRPSILSATGTKH